MLFPNTWVPKAASGLLTEHSGLVEEGTADPHRSAGPVHRSSAPDDHPSALQSHSTLWDRKLFGKTDLPGRRKRFRFPPPPSSQANSNRLPGSSPGAARAAPGCRARFGPSNRAARSRPSSTRARSSRARHEPGPSGFHGGSYVSVGSDLHDVARGGAPRPLPPSPLLPPP